MEQAESDDGAPIGFDLVGANPRASGDPVLILPGGPCRDPVYLGDLAGLAENRPLAVVHFRGTPSTGGLSRGWWTDAADAIAVIDQLGLSTVDVIAHSAGTRVALSLATRFPERLRSLALVTPAAAWLTETPHDGAAIATRRPEPEIIEALASMNVEPADENAFQHAWRAEAAAGYARWTTAERQHAQVGSMSLAAAHAWFRDIPADAAARIQNTTLPPTLVLGGADDILSGVETVRAFATALRAELLLIDDCGHYPWIERPEPFRFELERWLTSRGAHSPRR
ncbi:alpha/beta fold hydrolase [Microbacterium saperdae]|uniref:Pimeloyl-ACP methyl ester carboxylesterase n=1 Tax=Microbacterium saperdae TaxID=69368 RepID=A0A543BN34_9MICO|nr:alpha/beta hydrolase [Microbacterium saperdae]TQL86247.1 pimeloyl-ACP methyl ester carboxylesterase [Microbacterium saperdae]GGM49484.1 hydrolase [Microbacterium saperdae]